MQNALPTPRHDNGEWFCFDPEACSFWQAGSGLVLKVNTDEYPALGAQFRVQSIPYFVLLRGGIIIAE